MKNCLILPFMFFSFSLLGQKAFVEVGLGTGNVLEAKHRAGKGILFLHGHLKVSDHIQTGIELSAGGNLLPVDGTSTILDTTEVLSPYSARFNMAVLTAKYSLQKPYGQPFLSIGAGINTYKMYVHAMDTKQVSHHNFVGVAEIGIVFKSGVSTSLRYHSKGKTPSFNGSDDNGLTKILEQESVSMIYLTIGYQWAFD